MIYESYSSALTQTLNFVDTWKVHSALPARGYPTLCSIFTVVRRKLSPSPAPPPAGRSSDEGSLIRSRVEGAGDKFRDDKCTDCAKSGEDPFTETKFTRSKTKFRGLPLY